MRLPQVCRDAGRRDLIARRRHTSRPFARSFIKHVREDTAPLRDEDCETFEGEDVVILIY
jgi:hypothetical protein